MLPFLRDPKKLAASVIEFRSQKDPESKLLECAENLVEAVLAKDMPKVLTLLAELHKQVEGNDEQL